MQVIFAFIGNPEDYVRTDAHLKVCRPKVCPNCMICEVLLALGYYSRWVSSSSHEKVTRIKARRFRCHDCRLSTSMLPDFAQPYRLVETDTVDAFLAGNRSGDAVKVWIDLLGGYQRRFESQLPETRLVLSSAYALADLPQAAVELWEEIRKRFGGARVLTSRLVREVRITVFGIYQCHRPTGGPDVHTSRRFTCERSPPLWSPGHENEL
jgi:hypothetical protein